MPNIIWVQLCACEVLHFSLFYIIVTWISLGFGLLDGQNQTSEDVKDGFRTFVAIFRHFIEWIIRLIICEIILIFQWFFSESQDTWKLMRLSFQKTVSWVFKCTQRRNLWNASDPFFCPLFRGASHRKAWHSFLIQ